MRFENGDNMMIPKLGRFDAVLSPVDVAAMAGFNKGSSGVSSPTENMVVLYSLLERHCSTTNIDNDALIIVNLLF